MMDHPNILYAWSSACQKYHCGSAQSMRLRALSRTCHFYFDNSPCRWCICKAAPLKHEWTTTERLYSGTYCCTMAGWQPRKRLAELQGIFFRAIALLHCSSDWYTRCDKIGAGVPYDKPPDLELTLLRRVRDNWFSWKEAVIKICHCLDSTTQRKHVKETYQ